MPLLYSCVSYGTKVLADYADVTGNWEVVTQEILDKTQGRYQQHTYRGEQYHFHVLIRGRFTFLVVADENFPTETSFRYLEKIGAEFIIGNPPKNIKDITPYGLRGKFSSTMSSCLAEYNKTKEVVTDSAPRETRLDIVNEERETEDNISEFQLQEDCAIKLLREQVQDIKGIMSRKLRRVFSREVLIKTMDVKTRELLDNTKDFKIVSIDVNKREWWRNRKIVISAITVSLICSTVIVLFIFFSLH
ncbi:vesicle-associated membrane protein 7B-like [Bolinopsis microptera]|uniref:vesicle-associated membrane protein 7B-like n=1 Tax=Bolinopsis microptera TaxID=2820187 RepID=UPI00307B0C55